MTKEIFEIKLNNCNTKDKHTRRDNKYGVSWCVICGKLFDKPGGIKLKEEDKIIINKLT